MATTWIDVADTAVKIGLGAAIAGVVSILIPLISLKKETVADRRARRLKLIEDSIVTCNTYFSGEMTYAGARTDVLKGIFDPKLARPNSLERFQKADTDFDNRSASREKCVSHLELLGYHDLASKIRELKKLFRIGGDELINSKTAQEAQMVFDSLKTNARRLRTEINLQFGQIYSLEPEIKELFAQFK